MISRSLHAFQTIKTKARKKGEQKKVKKGFVELTFFLGPISIMESSKKEFLQQETSIYTQQDAAIQMTSASSDYDLKKKKKVVWISRS